MKYSALDIHVSKTKSRHGFGSILSTALQVLTIIVLLLILISVITTSDFSLERLFKVRDDSVSSTSVSVDTSPNSSRLEFLRFFRSEALNRTLQKLLTFHPEKIFQVSFGNTLKPLWSSSAHNESTGINGRCSHHSCFDIYRCETLQSVPEHGKSKYFVKNGRTRRLKVFVYPRIQFHNSSTDTRFHLPMSLEFSRILAAISNSSYFTDRMDKACLFIPNIDLLVGEQSHRTQAESVLWSLPNFASMSGANHLIFSFALPQSESSDSEVKHPVLNIGNVLLAAGGFDLNRYQSNFDVSIPTYSVFSRLYEDSHFVVNFNLNRIETRERLWTAVFTQINSISPPLQSLLAGLKTEFSGLGLFDLDCTQNHSTDSTSGHELPDKFFPSTNPQLLQLYHNHRICIPGEVSMRYLDVLHQSKYCILLPSNSSISLTMLSDYLMSGCIPVIVVENLVLPFEEEIDWTLASIRIWTHQLDFLPHILSAISSEREAKLRRYGLKFWEKYFSTPEAIALKTLDIINDRVFSDPNSLANTDSFGKMLDFANNDGFFATLSPKSLNLNAAQNGFTTVILSYNRLETLFQIITSVDKVPSCVKIVVVWNSQVLKPPKNWPSVVIPLEVIVTRSNKLSNRFFPYSAIRTEAIFSIDDDITMLNADEIEFAYQTWTQFPDRIVGFPSKLHVWNNLTQSWNYDSEWRNQVSLVLTGAAFYHRYYNFLYTFIQSPHIREWVDQNMNCEDIAMNFLISNVTCASPIKVTPRKKFKCPQCTAPATMSVDGFEHLQARSRCVQHFQKLYGYMPLKAVEFRANPVLYKDNIPDKFKLFGSIGQL